MIPVGEMVAHVTTLCESHGVDMRCCQRSTQSFALREFAEITIAPVKSAISYATALHEIGHILGPNQGSSCSLVRERGAWKWAEQNALIWTPRMQRHLDLSLQWYANGGAASVDDAARGPSRPSPISG